MLTELARWADDGDEPVIPAALIPRLAFLDQHLFGEFEPTRSGDHFQVRIARWLDHVQDTSDKRRLLTLLDHLYFVGREEFDVLYEQAFGLQVMRWLHDGSTQLGGEDHAVLVERELAATWFCPLTDSMNISRFYHLNRLEGRNLRPDWHSLSRLGDNDRINRFLKDEGIRRLVLLEDFVGSGHQAATALQFADRLDDDLHILFVPLIVAPKGLERLSALANAPSGRLTVEPVVALGTACVLGPEPAEGEPAAFPELRRLLMNLDPLVGGSGDSARERAFGYRGTGSLVVLFSNCPNNAPPVLHQTESPTWEPLFPRSTRA